MVTKSAPKLTDTGRRGRRFALAICHCWRAPTIARMAEATWAEARLAQQRVIPSC